jgi:hypothetical protein
LGDSGGVCGAGVLAKYSLKKVNTHHMVFNYKNEILFIVNVLMPSPEHLPYLCEDLRKIILQYSGHLRVSRRQLSWTVFQ